MIRLWANTLVKEGALELDAFCAPVSTSKLDTPWYRSEDSSAGA